MINNRCRFALAYFAVKQRCAFAFGKFFSATAASEIANFIFAVGFSYSQIFLAFLAKILAFIINATQTFQSWSWFHLLSSDSQCLWKIDASGPVCFQPS
jgi:hypothetical protein